MGWNEVKSALSRIKYEYLALKEYEAGLRERESVSEVSQPIAERRVLELAGVVNALNMDVDEHPHIVIFGDSGSGKTTLAQLIAGVRPGKLVILDPKRPKGWEQPKWGGMPYISRDRDGSYASMLTAIRKVTDRMRIRYEQQEYALEPFEQLTVILDEGKVTADECEEIATEYLKIVSMGRDARVRLILISTTDRARKLGFDGEADSLESFTHLRLGHFGARILPMVKTLGAEKHCWAAVRLGGDWQAFDTSSVLELVELLSKRIDGPSKVWSEVAYNCQVAHGSDDDVLAELLAVSSVSFGTSSGTSSGTSGNSATAERGVEPGPNASSNGFQGTVSEARNLLNGASADEKRNLGTCLKLFTALGKEKAILQGFNVTKGRGYLRGKDLLDAWAVLQERGLIT